jgi:hypothetical protein
MGQNYLCSICKRRRFKKREIEKMGVLKKLGD